MDIDFIEEKDRDSVFKLMELCGLDMVEAYQLYINADSSFEKAMQMHFNQGPAYNQSHDAHPSSYDNGGSYGNYVDEEDDFDILYQKFKQYKMKPVKFGDRYEVRKNTSFLSSIVPKFLKSESESNFKKIIEEYMGKTCPIKFSAQSLSATLCHSQKFPTIVYILDLSAPMKQKIDELLRNPQLVDMVNVQFKNVGIDPTYDIEKKLEAFVDRKKFRNFMVVLRVNAVEEVQVVTEIGLAALGVKEVLEKLKLAKNTCISKDLDDGHLQMRFNKELMGIFEYEKPMSIIERRKMAQDRQIRKKQEQQFFASMKAQQSKQKPKSQSQPQQPKSKQPTQSTQSKQAVVPPAPKVNIPEQRKKLRESLKTYSSGMNIKLRLPDGQSTILVVDQNEKAEYLFKYVESIDKDIGFEKDNDRKFDIIRPYDKLNLSNLQTKLLKDIFEDSQAQNLVVSERD